MGNRQQHPIEKYRQISGLSVNIIYVFKG